MAEIARLNGVIRVLEQGKPSFVTFSPAEIGAAQAINAAPYDGVVSEMEHRPYDIRALRDCLQFMLDRRQILHAGSLAPAVTPFVRIPPNGGEISQWAAKQVLDQGVYGIVWPHVSTVEEARNAVIACRYPRPRSAAYYEPPGQRGDAPAAAARYWGLTQQEYYARADVWPLNAGRNFGCHHVRGGACDQKSAADAPTGARYRRSNHREGDLSQDLGYPRQYDHPTVASAIDEILAICKQHNVACGHPHVDSKNVEALIEKGFRYLMPGPTYSFTALEIGRRRSGRE